MPPNWVPITNKTLSLIGLKNFFSQPDGFRSYLNVFILPDEFDRLLQIQNTRWYEANRLIGSGRTHICKLFLFYDIDVQIAAARVFPHNHALIHLSRRPNENYAAFLQVVDRIAGSDARPIGNQRSGWARFNVALPFDISMEQRIHDCRTFGIGQHFAANTDQSPRRNMKLEADTARPVVDHLDHLPFAGTHLFDHDADELFRAVDHKQFQRFVQFAVNRACQDFRLTHLKFIAFAPHHLDENGELQFAAAHHLKRVRPAGFFNANRNVRE